VYTFAVFVSSYIELSYQLSARRSVDRCESIYLLVLHFPSATQSQLWAQYRPKTGTSKQFTTGTKPFEWCQQLLHISNQL